MFILYAYVLVISTANRPDVKDWVNKGEFTSSKACMEAADKLKFQVFQCIAKGN